MKGFRGLGLRAEGLGFRVIPDMLKPIIAAFWS